MTEAGSNSPARPMGLLARAIGVITSPRATFENIVAHPRPFAILFLVAVVIALTAGVPQFTESGRQAALDAQIRNTERMTGQPMGPEQIERMERFSQYTGYFAIVGAFIFLPIFSLIITAIYWALFNALLGGTASFKQVLAVVTHSQVIGALGALIGVPIQLMQGTMSMGGPFNLGALAPMLDEGSRLAGFLGAISVFTVWGVFVTAIGLGVLYRRKTTGIFIALLALTLLITAVFTVFLPGMMGGSS